jgi:hypothetical protein
MWDIEGGCDGLLTGMGFRELHTHTAVVAR